jgi:ribosomal protein L11 methylase PrmA
VQSRYADRQAEVATKKQTRGMSKTSLLGLIDNLKNTVQSLTWKPEGTDWGEYYTFTNYSDAAFEEKKRIIDDWVNRIRPQTVWDMGANTGVFTRLASDKGVSSVSFDIDPAAVEKNYLHTKASKEKNILPLVMDLTNPSPSLGWNHEERDSLTNRAPVDMVFALAIIHHLAISNNVPLPQVAEFLHGLGKWLVIEFVPKSDSQVQKLLSSRLDIFDQYNFEGFEHSFSANFEIREKVLVEGTERLLYLLEGK